MIFTIFLLTVTIALFIFDRSDYIDDFMDFEIISSLKVILTVLSIVWLLMIPIIRTANNETLFKYKCFIENYEKKSNNENNVENATLTIKFIEWDNRIQLYERQNDTWGDIFISDKELNEALEIRNKYNK